MIKVVICDGAGTVGLPTPSDDVKNLLRGLHELGVELAVATNSQSAAMVKAAFKRADLPVPKYIAAQPDLRFSSPKPNPEFVYYIQELASVELSEIAFIGDSDMTDIFCALNAKVLPFGARYSNEDLQYGIPVFHPKAFYEDYLRTFGQQDEPYFGWAYQGRILDDRNRVEVFALFGDHGGMGLTSALTNLLKDHRDQAYGSNDVKLSSLVFHYLVNQLFLSGLRLNIDLITVYPGHLAGSQNELLADYAQDLAKLTKRTVYPDLLVRHEDAPRSRSQPKEERDIYDQFRTILVNRKHQKKVRDRTILVIDDFTTTGNSLETARRMLLQAGARHVISLAVGKYGIWYNVARTEKSWDPYVPCTLAREDIRIAWRRGTINKPADEHFANEILPVYAK